MPDVSGKEKTIDDSGPQQLFPGLSGPWHIQIHNLESANLLFVGDANVTNTGANKGATLPPAAPHEGMLEPSGPVVNPENIYAVAASTKTVVVSLFAIRAA